jgi:hypothetical protein
VKATCPVCSEPLEARPGRGRRATYCSARCRRILELRRRTWDAELARLERECLRHDEFATKTTRAAWTQLRDDFLRDHPRP